MILVSQADPHFLSLSPGRTRAQWVILVTFTSLLSSYLWNSEMLITLTAVTIVLPLTNSDHVYSSIATKSQVRVSSVSMSVSLMTFPELGIKGKDIDHQCSCLTIELLEWDEKIFHLWNFTFLSRLPVKKKNWGSESGLVIVFLVVVQELTSGPPWPIWKEQLSPSLVPITRQFYAILMHVCWSFKHGLLTYQK